MSALRAMQNFSGLHATVVSTDDDPAQPLAVTLNRLGIVVSLSGTEFTPGRSLDSERDLLFVDGDLDLSGLIASMEDHGLSRVPIIGLLGIEAPGRLRALMTLGATAFLRKPVHGASVFSAIFLGVNAQRQRRQMEGQLIEHDRRRRGRRFVVKAVLAMMRQQNVDDDQAYEVLRRGAMRARSNIEDFCESWLGDRAAVDAEASHHIPFTQKG
jgi:AmiR/NasT family two-component response regulator